MIALRSRRIGQRMEGGRNKLRAGEVRGILDALQRAPGRGHRNWWVGVEHLCGLPNHAGERRGWAESDVSQLRAIAGATGQAHVARAIFTASAAWENPIQFPRETIRPALGIARLTAVGAAARISLHTGSKQLRFFALLPSDTDALFTSAPNTLDGGGEGHLVTDHILQHEMDDRFGRASRFQFSDDFAAFLAIAHGSTPPLRLKRDPQRRDGAGGEGEQADAVEADHAALSALRSADSRSHSAVIAGTSGAGSFSALATRARCARRAGGMPIERQLWTVDTGAPISLETAVEPFQASISADARVSCVIA